MMIIFLLLVGSLYGLDFEEECEDHTWQCITWKRYCNDPMNRVYMERNCRETCGLCPKCEDLSWRCKHQSKYCSDKANVAFMKKSCRKTCNLCNAPTAKPLPPPTPTWPVIPSGPCGVVKYQGGRIINGVDAKKGAWPWQVLIKFMADPHCGGTLISPFWVITAAHCIEGKEPLIDDFEIVVGDDDFDEDEGTEVTIGASKLFVHEKFNRENLDNDIAMIKLNRPVPFNKYSAVACLPQRDEVVPVGTNCFITGWGKVQASKTMHHKLQQAMLPVVEQEKCQSLNTNNTNLPITERMLCAGYGSKKTTGGCHGDSGGPLVCPTGPNGRWVLHGSVSWGAHNCAAKDAYTVFARTTSFRDWIDSKMANN